MIFVRSLLLTIKLLWSSSTSMFEFMAMTPKRSVCETYSSGRKNEAVRMKLGLILTRS